MVFPGRFDRACHAAGRGLGRDLPAGSERIARVFDDQPSRPDHPAPGPWQSAGRSEEHTSELQSLMRISYAVFCLKKKKQLMTNNTRIYKLYAICILHHICKIIILRLST